MPTTPTPVDRSIRTPRAALAILFLATLAACGGGGGGDAPASPPTSGNPAPPPPPAARFTITLAQERAVVLQGAATVVQARVEREAGFDEPVTIELAGLPPGTSASPVIVPAGASEVNLTIAADAAAAHSLPTGASATGRAGALSASKPLTVTVRGLPGAVDTSFAGGSVITPVDGGEDFAHAVAVQADGKVLVAGASSGVNGTRLSIVRYTRDGVLDPGFGNGGKVLTSLAPAGLRADDRAAAIVVQPDGKIVVAGSSQQGDGAGRGLDFALVRYHADGSLDAGFGNGGVVLTDLGSTSDRAHALVLMPDGKIVAGGETHTGTTAGGVDFALVRYRADGTPDAGFGQGGKVVTPLKSGNGTDIVRALAVQTINGGHRVLAVGGDGDFQAARYTDAGALDASFGAGGKVSGLFGSNIGSAYAVTLLPGGEAVLAGHVGHDFAAAQLTPDGRLDPRFGAARDGRIRHAVSSSNWDEATAIVRQADGRLLLGGWVMSGLGSAGDFAALRLNADGSVDGGFGQAGVTVQPMAAGTRNDMAHGVVLQSDERIPAVRALIGGEASGSNHDFALTRLWL